MLNSVSRDKDGFLNDAHRWTETLAEELAQEQSIDLGQIHLSIIRIVRKYYLEHQLHLTNRALIKLLRTHEDYYSIDSITLHQLFGEHPAKQIALIAGLPKPPFCY